MVSAQAAANRTDSTLTDRSHNGEPNETCFTLRLSAGRARFCSPDHSHSMVPGGLCVKS
jgi:hypothetical protein